MRVKRVLEKQVSVHIPLTLARKVDALVVTESVPHRSRDEFVRAAVGRIVNEVLANPDSAFARAGLIPSGFDAQAGLAKPRPGAADDRSSAPGNYAQGAGAERGIVG